MSLEIIKEIKVDFHNTKYISVNAKQYDIGRYISVSCYNQGNVFPINNIENYAFIRYRKPDELNVFNSCEITNNGKILIKLTEQMLSFSGRAYVDIVIVNNTPVSADKITINNGELLTNENANVLSTMLLTVNVIDAAIDNNEIESTNEYEALNELLIKATNDYSYIMKACKISEENALMSETNAKFSEQSANTSEMNARISEDNALNSEINAKASEEIALEAKEIAIEKSNIAIDSANIVSEKTDIVLVQAEEVDNNVLLAKSYTMGETGSRINEETDNAKYYYHQSKAIKDGLSGAFTAMGTIKFSQIQSVIKDTGYVYHVNEDFITDNTFKCGAGVSYSAGTNIYYTSDGYWDCLVPKEVDIDFVVTDDNDGNVVVGFYGYKV